MADEETDVGRIAKDMIARYGEQAELIAAGHADTMLDQGDVEAFEHWRSVAETVRAIRANGQCSS